MSEEFLLNVVARLPEKDVEEAICLGINELQEALARFGVKDVPIGMNPSAGTLDISQATVKHLYKFISDIQCGNIPKTQDTLALLIKRIVTISAMPTYTEVVKLLAS